MIAMEALKEGMKIREIRPAVLCDRLGIKSNVLSERFKQKNVSVTKLNEMLRLMDYKNVVVPRDSRVPEGGFEIECDMAIVESVPRVKDTTVCLLKTRWNSLKLRALPRKISNWTLVPARKWTDRCSMKSCPC